jgi:hypothetical protein
MNFFDVDSKVLAAVIASAGTVFGALIQLRASWRKELAERARGAPVTKKSRRGPIVAISVLLVAAAIAGFAGARFLQSESQRDADSLRAELASQLAMISATAERLSQATLKERETSVPGESRAVAAVAATVGPCRPPSAEGAPACTESDAVRMTLCASVPAGMIVADTSLYATSADARPPAPGERVQAGQDLGRARFVERPGERVEADGTRLVCAPFADWDAEHEYRVRVAVTYTPGTRPEASSNASLLTSTRAQ